MNVKELFRTGTFFQMILNVFVLLFVMSAANAKPYFQGCKTALAEPSFHLFRDYLDTTKQLLDPNHPYTKFDSTDECFQLNDSQFVVIDPIMHVFYCHLTDTKGCEQVSYNWDIMTQGEMHVAEEVEGNEGQHFVLLSLFHEVGGFYLQEYYVLFLARAHNYPFNIQQLARTGGVDEEGYCHGAKSFASVSQSNPPDPHQIYFRNPVYHIEHVGQKDVTIVFHMKRENCNTLKTINYQEHYVFRNNHFVKIS